AGFVVAPPAPEMKDHCTTPCARVRRQPGGGTQGWRGDTNRRMGVRRVVKSETMKPAEGGRATFRGETLPPRLERDKATSPAAGVGGAGGPFPSLRSGCSAEPTVADGAGIRARPGPIALRPVVLAQVGRPDLKDRFRAPLQPKLLAPLDPPVQLLDRALHRRA